MVSSGSKSITFAITPLDPTLILAQVGEDLTVRAHEGKLPKIVGREKELDQIIKVLGRRAKCNPLILGEAGVGKTALCHALAARIVKGNVPNWLVGRKVIRTSFFEIWGSLDRTDHDFAEYARVLKQVIKVCRENPIILFMDEFHTLVNYPISSNVIKPHLADGSLRMIGATTLLDYRTYIERDEALARRFVPVVLEEPSREQTLKILCELKTKYESDDSVRLTDKVIGDIVDLSETYMQNRHQPDKSIDLLELSCIEANCENHPGLSKTEVTTEVVKEVTSALTGIPHDLLMGKTDRLTGMVQTLSSRYVGQEEAIRQIAHRLVVTKSRQNLEVHRPDGVFLLVGQQGVGKTELARSVASMLSDQPEDFIRLDMALYGDRYALAGLLGSIGTQGMGHVPLLTHHIKNRPSALLLLEDIDRAHPEVFRALQQIFVTGRILDFQGTEIIFDHVTIFMTTRVGFENSSKRIGITKGPLDKNWENQKRAVYQAVQKAFPSEFLQCVDEVVILKSMTSEMLKALMAHKVRAWAQRIGKRIVLSDSVAEALIKEIPLEGAGTYCLIRLMDQRLGDQIQRIRLEENWELVSGIAFDLDSSGRIISKIIT